MNNDVLYGHQWNPLQAFGFTHAFWSLQLDTIVSTFTVVLIIICISLSASYFLQKKDSITRFAILTYVKAFKGLLEQTLFVAEPLHLAMIGSLFTFILCCNTISAIPWLEEPTKDLNTTLALGLISFFYVHTVSVRHNGVKAYIADYFEPFFVMFPLNFVGTITSIISLSFRLFGNIFGGFIISTLYHQMMSSSVILRTLGTFSGLNLVMLIIFGVFEGVIQAFVFSMLTLTYLSMEIVDEEES